MHNNLAILLFSIGLITYLAKVGFEWNGDAGGDQSWRVSISASFEPLSPKAQVYIQTPFETDHIKEVNQSVSKEGLQLTNTRRFQRRVISAVAKRETAGTLTLVSQLVLSQNPRFLNTELAEKNEKILQASLDKSEFQQRQEALVDALQQYLKLPETDRNDMPGVIFDYVSSTPLQRIRDVFLADLDLRTADKTMAELMVALCRSQFIPARLVEGLQLSDNEKNPSTFWAEVYLNDEWVPYHPARGYAEALPHTYIAFDKSGAGIVSFREAKPLTVSLNVLRVDDTPASLQVPDNWTQVLHFNRLAAEVRDELAILMMLPLGALLTAIIRQFGGAQTYGVFTPTMLALAITYTDTMTTLTIILVTMVGIFIGRPTFDSSINRTTRLSVIFTFVALCMVFGVSILDYMELASDGHLVLLPIVIITSVIDRFFALVEQKSYVTALIRMAWTVLISLFISSLFQWRWVGYHFLAHPELHLVTISLLLFIKDYSGWRLLNLKKFSFLTEAYWDKRYGTRAAPTAND